MVVLKAKKDVQSFKINEPSSLQDENQLLKSSLNYLKTELNKFKELPLLAVEVKKQVGKKVLIKVPNGSHFLVNVSGDVSLESGDTALVEQRSLTIVKKLDESKSLDVENFLMIEKPNVSWESLGGLTEQINELREVVELPLLKPQLFKDVGIDPPKGVILYGT